MGPFKLQLHMAVSYHEDASQPNPGPPEGQPPCLLSCLFSPCTMFFSTVLCFLSFAFL